jgi:hypothetical protein
VSCEEQSASSQRHTLDAHEKLGQLTSWIGVGIAERAVQAENDHHWSACDAFKRAFEDGRDLILGKTPRY